MVSTKDEFLELPILRRRPTEYDEFVAQVFFCVHGGRTPEACKFFESNPKKRTPSTPRPTCPDHPTEDTFWANIYNVANKEYRYHST